MCELDGAAQPRLRSSGLRHHETFGWKRVVYRDRRDGIAVCPERSRSRGLGLRGALPAGKIVANSDLPDGYTLSVNNRTSGHPDKGIVFYLACSPGTVATDCSGEDPDLMTPGPSGGVGNDRAQGKVLIIAEDVVDASPTDGLVDDPDDERGAGTLTFALPSGCGLRSLRLIDIDCNEESTKIVLRCRPATR